MKTQKRYMTIQQFVTYSGHLAKQVLELICRTPGVYIHQRGKYIHVVHTSNGVVYEIWVKGNPWRLRTYCLEQMNEVEFFTSLPKSYLISWFCDFGQPVLVHKKPSDGPFVAYRNHPSTSEGDNADWGGSFGVNITKASGPNPETFGFTQYELTATNRSWIIAAIRVNRPSSKKVSNTLYVIR